MKKILLIFAILVIVLPASYYLFGTGYFNMHDDLQVMRIFEMEKCLSDGQIPCRWSPDMGWGYGQAMFNFYSAFPYYLGAFIRIITPLSIIATVKLLFFISILTSALGMYLLAKEFWGRWGGVLAAVLYTYAPYHAVDVYVRGALAESFSLALLPFLWLFIHKLIRQPYIKNTLTTSLFLALLLLTHNISTMMYAIPSVLWALFWLVKEKKKLSICRLGLAGLLGVGLSSFFLIPGVAEQRLIQVENLVNDYSNYRAHFVTVRQLFLSRFWGDGPSIFGPVDGMSFQIGWPHWWILTPLIIGGILWLRKYEKRQNLIILSGLIALFLFSSFLAHPRSIFIWERIPIMSFVQFPWRFLGLSIFFISFAGGALAKINLFGKKLLYVFFFISAVVLNVTYFKPLHFSRLVDDASKLSGLAFDLQRRAAIVDYLPKSAKIAPKGPAFESPKLISGAGEISGYDVASNRFSFEAKAYEYSEIEIPVMYFPGWILIIDNNEVIPGIHGDLGTISASVLPGNHIIRGRFTNTPIRTLANAITVISIGSFFMLLQLSERKFNE